MGVLAGTGLLLAAAMVEQKTGEQRRAAVHAVGEVLARAPDLSSAAPAILRSICLELDCTFASIWLVDTDTQRLPCLTVWRDATLPLEFETTTMAMECSRGVGLPGRVWAEGQPLWVENVIKDPIFRGGALLNGSAFAGRSDFRFASAPTCSAWSSVSIAP